MAKPAYLRWCKKTQILTPASLPFKLQVRSLHRGQFESLYGWWNDFHWPRIFSSSWQKLENYCCPGIRKTNIRHSPIVSLWKFTVFCNMSVLFSISRSASTDVFVILSYLFIDSSILKTLVAASTPVPLVNWMLAEMKFSCCTLLTCHCTPLMMTCIWIAFTKLTFSEMKMINPSLPHWHFSVTCSMLHPPLLWLCKHC